MINATGAVLTGLVLVIVTISKFAHGAWIVTIAMPLLFLVMKSVRRHYRNVADELRVADDARPEPPSRNRAVMLVSTLHAPTMRALGYAQSMRPDNVEALTVAVDPAAAEDLRQKWESHEIGIPLKVLESPYREITRPVLEYVRALRRESPRDVVTVLIPEYVLGRWWEQILHNQSALRLKARLLFTSGVMVISVPYLLQSAQRRKARERKASESTPEALAERA